MGTISHHLSLQPLENAADERWEDEGGAVTLDLAERRLIHALPPRACHVGEGRIEPTIPQDGQDRSAGRS